LCDLPIPLLYRELDKAYPGSKFILTLRDENSWLKSVQKHYDPRYNPQQPGWAEDGFTNTVHAALYGRISFDAETCLRVYRQHNADVLEYFKDRPEDLLILNVSKGEGWEKLCPFLKQPIPSKPYPHKNATTPEVTPEVLPPVTFCRLAVRWLRAKWTSVRLKFWQCAQYVGDLFRYWL
jgi:hypothetical protein